MTYSTQVFLPSTTKPIYLETEFYLTVIICAVHFITIHKRTNLAMNPGKYLNIIMIFLHLYHYNLGHTNKLNFHIYLYIFSNC